MTYQILLADDDRTFGAILKKKLDSENFNVMLAFDGKSALRKVNDYRFDACILDINMPYLDGYELASEIRATKEDLRFIFVSSHSDLEKKLAAFSVGAEDYIEKPFHADELVARLHILLNRKDHNALETETVLPSELPIGAYTLDRSYNLLRRGEDEQKMTAREVELLTYLYANRNQQIKRKIVLQEIWGDDDYYKSRSLDVFISRLRKYLRDDDALQIVNIHGIGFKFAIPE